MVKYYTNSSPESWNDMSLPERIKHLRAEKKLNILPGQRIGWERKSECLHELAEYSAEGYLSQDEWEIRRQHVEQAQTEEELSLAMTDLQSAHREMVKARERRVEARDLAKVTEVAKKSTSFLSSTLFYFLMWIASIISMGVNFLEHDMVFFGIAIGGVLFWGILLGGRVVKKT